MPQSKRRILVVAGTRPEAIKLAPVVLSLRKRNTFEVRLCSTGQHREMLDSALQIFNLFPDVDLDLMKRVNGLHELVAEILRGMQNTFAEWRPDVVMVHGDTATCLATALAAFYSQLPVAHVEAGLRTGDLTAPFPEEANRSMVARIATYHFAPTETARENLLREGVHDRHIYVTGNTVIDALLHTRRRCTTDISWPANLPAAVGGSRILLVTGHRRENVGEPFERMCAALTDLARNNQELQVVYPVHLNPLVRNVAEANLSGHENIHLIEPLDYQTFVALLDRCELVLTDSGGIQEEAPALGKPVLVMRDTTERPEAIAAGTALLVGTREERIRSEIQRLLDDRTAYHAMAQAQNPYGDGRAAQRITDTLESVL